jgi:hypothetical protein
MPSEEFSATESLVLGRGRVPTAPSPEALAGAREVATVGRVRDDVPCAADRPDLEARREQERARDDVEHRDERHAPRERRDERRQDRGHPEAREALPPRPRTAFNGPGRRPHPKTGPPVRVLSDEPLDEDREEQEDELEESTSTNPAFLGSGTGRTRRAPSSRGRTKAGGGDDR